MSDRSPLQIKVYAVNDEDRPAVLEAILEEGMDDDWGDGPEPASVELGRLYGVRESPLGTSDTLAARLQKETPSAAFELWQDPHYTADGHYVAHVPGVGTFEPGSDAEGNPHIDVHDLLDRLTLLRADAKVHNWLSSDGDGLLGLAVLTALKGYKRAAGTTAADDASVQNREPLPFTSLLPMPQNVPWDDYPMLASDDGLKHELELIHTACGERLCDVEHKDTLLVLANVVADHHNACEQVETDR